MTSNTCTSAACGVQVIMTCVDLKAQQAQVDKEERDRQLEADRQERQRQYDETVRLHNETRAIVQGVITSQPTHHMPQPPLAIMQQPLSPTSLYADHNQSTNQYHDSGNGYQGGESNFSGYGW